MHDYFMLAASHGGSSGGSSNPVAFVIVSVVIFAVATTFAIKPRLSWRANRWQYKNPDALEPSAKGLLYTRVSSGVVAVIAVVFFVIGLTKL